jgi:DNA-binding protein HU-beta
VIRRRAASEARVETAAGAARNDAKERSIVAACALSHAVALFSARDLDTMRARLRCVRDAQGERMPSVVTKSDLVQAAARASNLSKAAAGEAVNAVFDAIVTNVAKGKRVTVVGFGTFLPRRRKARAGRNPVSGKEIKIVAKTIPAFAAGQGFREAVDK